MAKKSAKSKGFRKQTGKKPYLSKRDIILLCLLVAALAIASILLFRYDDGALKVKDGAVQVEGDNWLIVNGSNTRGGTRYFKLGEVGTLDGYDRETQPTADANIPDYVFTAQAEDAAARTVTLSTSHSGAEALAKYTASMLTAVETAEVGEVQSADLDGTPVQYYLYTAAPEAEAEEETAEAAGEAAEEVAEEATEASAKPAETEPWRKVLCGYVDAAHDSCVVFRVESSADAKDALADDDALLAALESALPVVTLEEAK